MHSAPVSSLKNRAKPASFNCLPPFCDLLIYVNTLYYQLKLFADKAYIMNMLKGVEQNGK
jgi:hypothetical protein